MAYRKKTIRRLPPKTREFAKILNELESVLNRAKNRLPEIARLELDSQALINARQMLSLEPERKRVKKQPTEQEELFPPEPNAELVHASRKERKRKEKPTDEQRPATVDETSPDSTPEPETETPEPPESNE